MNEPTAAIQTQLARQVGHWSAATKRLGNLDTLASPEAWSRLERYLGVSLRQYLMSVIHALNREAAALEGALSLGRTVPDAAILRRKLLAFRAQYLRVETTLGFFANAINSRTTDTVAGLLRACDTLAHRSMAQLLDPLEKQTPITLTYLTEGIGASIMRANQLLWDRTIQSPVAAIKIARHNLYRPTALIHEAGHQAAYIVGWNNELAAALHAGLTKAPAGVAETWAGWASEIAADAFAFVHTGYASVAALHDVLDGGPAMVFRHIPGDPHPVSFLRVLFGVEMCRQFYGAGPWDDLSKSWMALYPPERAPAGVASLIFASTALLPHIVHFTLREPMQAFGGKALATLINPERVKPETLLSLERRLGPAIYTSMHWIWTEALRLLALTGMLAATMTERKTDLLQQQEAWMLRLGGASQAA